MIQYISFLCLVLLSSMVFSTNVAASDKLAGNGHAKIDLQKETNKITVRSLYINGAEGQVLSYKLIVEKSGKSGTSNNAQSGTFEVKSGEKEIVLSTSGFSAFPQDKYFIQLQIFAGKEMISQDTLLFEPK